MTVYLSNLNEFPSMSSITCSPLYYAPSSKLMCPTTVTNHIREGPLLFRFRRFLYGLLYSLHFIAFSFIVTVPFIECPQALSSYGDRKSRTHGRRGGGGNSHPATFYLKGEDIPAPSNSRLSLRISTSMSAPQARWEGGAGGASAPGPGCLGGPGGKQKHRGGSRILSVGDPGFW